MPTAHIPSMMSHVRLRGDRMSGCGCFRSVEESRDVCFQCFDRFVFDRFVFGGATGLEESNLRNNKNSLGGVSKFF
jgi:hypothetical protein